VLPLPLVLVLPLLLAPLALALVLPLLLALLLSAPLVPASPLSPLPCAAGRISSRNAWFRVL
jgi:hypothetical protein